MGRTHPKSNNRSTDGRTDFALGGNDRRKPYGVRLSSQELEMLKYRANLENKPLSVYLRDQALKPRRLLDLQTWSRLAKTADHLDALFERLDAQNFSELANNVDDLRYALAKFRTALLVRKPSS